MKVKTVPLLTPEDLGIELEEDSEGVTSEEVQDAIETKTLEDFVAKAKDVVLRSPEVEPVFSLKRKGGILYGRLILGEVFTYFQVDWLRKK
jgi:hypothetical protein